MLLLCPKHKFLWKEDGIQNFASSIVTPQAVVGTQAQMYPWHFQKLYNAASQAALNRSALSVCSCSSSLLPVLPPRRLLAVDHLTPAVASAKATPDTPNISIRWKADSWKGSRAEVGWPDCRVLWSLKYFYQQWVLTSSPLSIKINLTAQGCQETDSITPIHPPLFLRGQMVEGVACFFINSFPSEAKQIWI